MFDFQKLDVYQKAKSFCIEIRGSLLTKDHDKVTNDQLRRASFSIMLNIAEGSSRFSNRGQEEFYDNRKGKCF
jgi:four helix bundle protein